MKNLAQWILAVAIMAASCITVSAQTSNDREQANNERLSREQMAERQARRIADQMAFDDATTTKFVNTYMAYRKEMWALEKVEKKREGYSEAEARQAIQEQFDRSQKLLDIKKKYYKEYSKFLTQKQIKRVYEMDKADTHRKGNIRIGGKSPNDREGRTIITSKDMSNVLQEVGRELTEHKGDIEEAMHQVWVNGESVMKQAGEGLQEMLKGLEEIEFPEMEISIENGEG